MSETSRCQRCRAGAGSADLLVCPRAGRERNPTHDTRSHEENWAEIVELVAQVDAARAAEELWPLTSDVRTCVHCLYQVVCGRQEAVANLRKGRRLYSAQTTRVRREDFPG